MADLFWAFLRQTLTATGVAALLLLVKYLFRDKLSPRWQYAIWTVLALRLVLPAGLGGRYALFPWPLWLEAVRIYLDRALPDAEIVAGVLCYVYLTGVAVSLGWYALAYGRLRLALRRGTQNPPVAAEQVRDVAFRYGLQNCATVAVPGLPSAFLCGVFHPVLALPQGVETDDKVLLHELLHLRYRDTLAGLLVCLLRCLHWCNPLLRYCCNEALNDCEALCDQRVLERLEGEERRDYGRILLSMADERYARAPGTSSMANGGAHIKGRIASIARFKRYPQGMAVASVCVALVLGWACLNGVKATDLPPVRVGGGAWPVAYAQAVSHLRRATTVAGALDTYAKGLIVGNPYYLAMVAPVGEEIALPDVAALTQGMQDYTVVALQKGADNLWLAQLAFYPGNSDWTYTYLLPVRVHQGGRGEGWTVRPDGPGQAGEWERTALPPSVVYTAQAGDYRVELALTDTHLVDNTVTSQDFFFATTSMDLIPKPDAAFDRMEFGYQATLTYTGDGPDFQHLAMRYGPLPDDWTPGDPGPELDFAASLPGNGSGSSSTGEAFVTKDIPPQWDGTLHSGGGSGRDVEEGFCPVGYKLEVYEDKKLVETLYLTPQEVTP